MRTSVSLSDELSAYVDEVSESSGENNAEAIREVVRHARRQDRSLAELEAERDELRSQIEDLEAEVDRLKNEKRLILQERQEKKELVRYVEHERTHQERWRTASFPTRLKWRLLGMPTES